MKYLNSRVIYSVLFYVLLIILIILAKPSIMFNSNGDIKLFGVGEDKTMFSLGVASILLALVSFYIFCLIDLVFSQK
jgi:hypothetical protein